MCLVVPIVPPSRAGRVYVQEQQQEAALRLKQFVTEAANPETES